MNLRIFYLFVLLVFVLFISIFVGPVKIPFDFWHSSLYKSIVYNIRTPRIILACIIGGGMSVSGAVYQSIFRNPLASPDVLGTAFGCAFGASVGILLEEPMFVIQVFSFFFGVLATLIAIYIAKKDNHIEILSLVISGIIIGSFFSSLLGIAKYFADPDNKLPAITFWLMGSFSDASWEDVYVSLFSILALFYIFYKRWFLNVAYLEDEESKVLGFDIHRFRIVMIGLSTIIVSISISLVGIVGWIGLVIPHFTKLIVGHDNKYLVPASFITGGIFLIFCDDIARSISTGEIPVGIITSFVSAPVFGFLYKTKIYAKNR